MRSPREWEAVLAHAVREVTGLEPGPGTSFFEAGLTSASLIEVFGRLRDELGPDVDVTVFFKFPTRRSLAAHLAAGPTSLGGGEPAVSGSARQWSAEDRRALRSRIRQRKG